MATEKRQVRRIPLTCTASCQFLKGSQPTGPSLPAITLDISTKGALIRTSQPTELNGKIQVQVQVPGAKSALLASGRTVRVEEEESGKSYLLGIAFEKTEPADTLGFLSRLESMDLQKLLESLLASKSSDLHLTLGHPPIVRVGGHLTPLEMPPFQSGEIQALVYSAMTEKQISEFEQQREMDFAYSFSLQERFRFNLHWQRGQVEAAIRVIPSRIPAWKDLGLPPITLEWIKKANGLILIVGPDGAGKSTTLNSLVHQINQEQEVVIICLERSIEYVHQNLKAVIEQREIGSDTLSYAEAVRRALRQDPDVIVVGEIEDAETAQVVLNAAESGNLILASFHATNTIQAIDRFLSFAPIQQRDQMSFQLASCLQGILTQYLIPREPAMGGGLILATEIFVPTDAARNHIRSKALSQLYSVIETGGPYQMHTLERCIRDLVTKGLVAPDVAENFQKLSGQRS